MPKIIIRQQSFPGNWQNGINILKKHYGINLAVGVGKTFEPFKMNHTYNEAKKALKVAQKHHEIVYYENLLLDIVLEEISAKTRQEFIDRILSEIQSDQELLERSIFIISINCPLKIAPMRFIFTSIRFTTA